jgi:thiol:disulfide interchange protein
MTIQKITNLEEYNALVETSKSKLVILDFSASWCVPTNYGRWALLRVIVFF